MNSKTGLPRQGADVPVGDNEPTTRNQLVRETLTCPHCGDRLAKWEVPDSPFNEWPSEFQYICFNDACSYFVGGWSTMASQGAFRFIPVHV